MNHQPTTSHPWFASVVATSAALLLALLVASGANAQESADEAATEDPGWTPNAGLSEGSGDATGPIYLERMRDESGGDRSAVGLGREFPRPDDLPEGIADELDAFEASLRIFEQEIENYRGTISRIVETEYRNRRDAIGSFYDNVIADLRVEESARRVEAIANFERFIERYPSSAEYTPDVMFRLAELYYEDSIENYRTQDREYQSLVARFDAGILAEQPPVPEYDFTRTIRLFDDLIQRFPNYHQLDGAYYLDGVCHIQMGEDDLAQNYFTVLVERYPDSGFAQEVWLRIGEYHFGSYDFETARDSYERSVSYGDSRWYDEGLFKLGWSNYLLANYEAAIGNFRSVLDYYEAQTSGSQAVREESAEYFAISLAEEDWDGDYEPDLEYIMPRVDRVLLSQDRPYNIEILDRLGERLLRGNQFSLAVEMFRRILRDHPLDRKNPERHFQLIAALVANGQEDLAIQELATIGLAYSPDSPWYREQERLGNAEALAYADDLARTSLLDSADNAYVAAEAIATRFAATGDPLLEAEARQGFRVAAALYAEFIEQYPDADETFDARISFAQALLYSAQYAAAAEEYETIRDIADDEDAQLLGATQAILAWARALEEQINLGTLEPRAYPGYTGPMAAVVEEEPEEELLPEEDEEQRSGPRAAPADEPIPELSLRWVAAQDRFVELGIEDPEVEFRDVKAIYATGYLYYAYKHFDESRARFIRVIDECRQINETGYAAAFLIESFTITNDLEALTFWSQELERRSSCVPEELRDRLAQDVDRMAMGEMARRADELVAEERFQEAAEEYIRLAGQYADNPDTASRALYNAGVIYETNLSRYADAMASFDRIVNEYGQTEFLDDALVRIAVNSKKFFDFERAIETYQTLDRMDYSSDLVTSPLLSAAELLQQAGRHTEAAEAFLRYVDDNPSDERSPEWVYRAALNYRDAGLMNDALSVFDRFRRRYGNDPGDPNFSVDAAVIESYDIAAEYYDSIGNSREAQRARDQLMREFNVRQPTNPVARGAAAEIAYNDAMELFNEWSQFEVEATLERRMRVMQDKFDQMPEIGLAFDEIGDYGVQDWTVCGLYMTGRIAQVLAETIRPFTLPPAGSTIEEEDAFYEMAGDMIMQIEDQMLRPAEDLAIEKWRVAYEVMQGGGVVNECTIDTIRQLNRVDPENYPLFLEGVRHSETQTFSPGTFAAPPAPARVGDDEESFDDAEEK